MITELIEQVASWSNQEKVAAAVILLGTLATWLWSLWGDDSLGGPGSV